MRYELWAVLRGREQMPLREGDVLHVRVGSLGSIYEIPIDLLEAILVGYLESIVLQARFAERLGMHIVTPPEDPKRKAPPDAYGPEHRQELRAQRRSRRRT